MTIAEINPHIRFAARNTHAIEPVWSWAYDCRLFYLTSGRGIFEFGSESHEITAGTLLIWPAGQRYRFRMEGDIAAVILNFDMTPQHAAIPQMKPVRDEEYDPALVLEQVEFSDCPALSSLILLRDLSGAEEALAELVREMREQKRYYAETASAILKRVLTHAARAAMAGSVRMSSAVEQVIAYIRENYARPITNRDISEQVNYHEFYVNKLMIKQTGMTLHHYLMSVRVQNASRLLISTDESAAHIAELCGFTSAAHFSGVFRRFTGESPAEYRKRRGML